MNNIDWTKQHCGVIEANPEQLREHMPNVAAMVFDTFPAHEYIDQFWWDVRVTMLMPGQYPAIPNWHFDHIPRKTSRTDPERDWKALRPDLPMYMWLSGPPFTEFKDKREVKAEEWIRFTQLDSHRAVASEEHCWRGFIRAVHKGIVPVRHDVPVLRRHSQVYLDAAKFAW